MRAVDIVRKVAPKGRKAYLDAFEQGDDLLASHGITTPLRLAQFLAQVMHESGGLTVEFENMNYRAPRIMEIFGEGRHSASISLSEAQHLAGKPQALAERVYGVGNPKKSKELGNTRPGDGYKYRGGGILQTTGKSNYRRMGEKCGVDFEGSPELVCSAEHALKPALAEWMEGKLNVLADKSDLKGITRKINGGYNGLADRQAWYKTIRPLCEGYSVEAVKPKPEAKIAKAPSAPAAAPSVSEPDDTKPHAAPAADSKTGISEGAKVGIGAGFLGLLTQAWEAISSAPETILQAIVAAAAKPAFWVFAVVILAALYVWWRRGNMKKAVA
jgi:putative chitinase